MFVLFVVAVMALEVVVVVIMVVMILVVVVVAADVVVSVLSTMSSSTWQFCRTFKEVKPLRTKNVIEEVALLHYGHEDFFNNFLKR
jgi:hypothetical protein